MASPWQKKNMTGYHPAVKVTGNMTSCTIPIAVEVNATAAGISWHFAEAKGIVICKNNKSVCWLDKKFLIEWVAFGMSWHCQNVNKHNKGGQPEAAESLEQDIDRYWSEDSLRHK